MCSSDLVEEPLEIRIGGSPVAVTMRTPGHDEELALGFCLSEGLRPAGARLPDDLAANTVDVDAPGFDPQRLQRSFYTTSSCGVCGKGALDAVAKMRDYQVIGMITEQLAALGATPTRTGVGFSDGQPLLEALWAKPDGDSIGWQFQHGQWRLATGDGDALAVGTH